MNNILVTIGVVVVIQLVWIVLTRTFPDILGRSIIAQIEQRHSIRLEAIKNELTAKSGRDLESLRADYSTLRSSTDYLAVNQGELRSKMILAAETLWWRMLSLREAFGDLIYHETLLTPSELSEAFKGGDLSRFLDRLAEFSNEDRFNAKATEFTQLDDERCRLLLGDKVWLDFFVYRAFITRIGYLTHRSFLVNNYVNWRKDSATKQLLRNVLPKEVVDKIDDYAAVSLPQLIGTIESAFMKDAMFAMSGSKTLSDSITDLQSTLLYEAAKVRDRQES